MAKSIAVAMLVDPMGSSMRTAEEEYEEHEAWLRKVFEGNQVRFQRLYYIDNHVVADLLLFDFGGMSPGNDLMASNSRGLIRWAQDHPSSLVAVMSMFTYANGVAFEMRELGLIADDAPLPSMVDETPALPMNNVLAGSLTVIEKGIREWFADTLSSVSRSAGRARRSYSSGRSRRFSKG